jgi:hypothetical protein
MKKTTLITFNYQTSSEQNLKKLNNSEDFN